MSLVEKAREQEANIMRDADGKAYLISSGYESQFGIYERAGEARTMGNAGAWYGYAVYWRNEAERAQSISQSDRELLERALPHLEESVASWQENGMYDNAAEVLTLIAAIEERLK